jgi:chromobox protein 1
MLNLSYREGAEEALHEYFEKLGGRPQPPEKPSKKRKSMGEAKSTPDSTAKRSRKSRGANGTETPEGNDSVPDWVPDSKNWEREVTKVETITRDPQTGGLMAYLQWQNGKKSRVSIEQCYEKIPMKVSRCHPIIRLRELTDYQPDA